MIASPLAFKALKISLLVIILFLQLSFSWRSVGLNGNPAGEIFWNGYFEGGELVRETIDNADLEVLIDGVDSQVAFLDNENAAVKWAVGVEYPYTDHLYGLVDTRYAVIISASNQAVPDESEDGYYGQDFVSSRYPLWTWQPFKSLLSSDFWVWLFFRQGQMLNEYNYIWVNKTLF